ncbi:MAG: hypothetical protein GXY44_12980 [Phycisphaerales bacterium]|nr:hypothetical protein [Phycisphaerales bacterium]
MPIRIVLIVMLLVSPRMAKAQDLTNGKWLVDLGRDYPLSAQAGLSAADGQIALLFMQAARRIEPDLAEACHWSYDLLLAFGREAEALDSLGRYVMLQPDDQPAYLDWIDLSLRNLQVAEQRVEFCREHLDRKNQPAEVLSHLHRRLAEVYFNRGDVAQAVREAESAVEAYPCNLAAVMLLDQLHSNQAGPVAQVQHLLRLLACNPADIGSTRRLAELLYWEGVPAEADRWYKHAISLYEHMPPYSAPPELLLARVSALIDSGGLDQAEYLLRQVNESHPDRIDGRLLNARLAEKRGDPATARRHIKAASESVKFMLANVGPTAHLDPGVLAEMAWFFAHYDAQPAVAERLARAVLAEQPDSPVAKRALGSALRQAGRDDDAIDLLKPLAGSDAWAAVELARVLDSQSRTGEARAYLQAASTQPTTGEQRAALAEIMGGPTSASASAPMDSTTTENIRAALESFDAVAIDYPLYTSRYLQVSVRPAETDFLPGRPWWCDFELKNNGPFAITLGPGQMTDADLLCIVETVGDRRRTSGASLRISLNRKIRLAPGETIVHRQTIDIGTIRAGMIGTPRMDHQVSVAAVLSPIATGYENGWAVWKAGLGGLELAPIRFRRRALGASRQALDTVLGVVRSGSVADRIRAAEILAMLLAEQQHLAAGRLNYKAARLDMPALQSAILGALRDREWSVRARVTESLRWFVLDEAGTRQAMELLNDEHWLVRGLAMRMLTDHFADKFLPVLERYAESDSDPWCREFAAALHKRTLEKQPPPPSE